MYKHFCCHLLWGLIICCVRVRNTNVQWNDLTTSHVTHAARHAGVVSSNFLVWKQGWIQRVCLGQCNMAKPPWSWKPFSFHTSKGNGKFGFFPIPVLDIVYCKAPTKLGPINKAHIHWWKAITIGMLPKMVRCVSVASDVGWWIVTS